MNTEYKIKLILLFNHVALIVGLMYASPLWLLLTLVGWIAFGKLGGEIGLHRYFSHKSFKTTAWKERMLLILSIFNCFGSSIMWVGVHRKHHVKSDTTEDPHGAQASWRIWLTFWKPFNIEMKYFADLLRDTWQKNIHKHYFKILIGSYILLALIDWRLPVFLISISSVISFHSAGMVNSLCHKYGYRNFDTNDTSTNNTWVNYITLGSGLHNNHHAAPASWTTKTTPSEIDFSGWLVNTLLKE